MCPIIWFCNKDRPSYKGIEEYIYKQACFDQESPGKIKYVICKWSCLENITDVDECIIQAPCENNGTCINNYGSYECLCDNGWLGDHCEKGTLQ